jgi:spore germination protein GerM
VPRPPSRKPLWLVLGIALAGVVLGVWLVAIILPRWLRSGGGTPTDVQSGAAADARRIHATLFFVSDDGGELVPVSREVPFGATPGEQARRVVEAQVQPAPPGLTSAIPPGTKVRGLYLTNHGEAFVDLSHEVTTGHGGGSLSETLTVFAVVNALTVNLPDVTAVQILIDGKEADTLAGHVDLRHPLGRSLKWVKRQ